jgi:hypothetical protein
MKPKKQLRLHISGKRCVFKILFYIHFYIKQSWNDPTITWNISEYDNIAKIIVPATDIWTPDLYGRQKYAYTHTLSTHTHNFRIEVTRTQSENEMRATIINDGTITIGYLETLRMFCSLKVAAFPYDIQTCILHIGSWNYDENELIVEPLPYLSLYSDNPGNIYATNKHTHRMETH